MSSDKDAGGDSPPDDAELLISKVLSKVTEIEMMKNEIERLKKAITEVRGSIAPLIADGIHTLDFDDALKVSQRIYWSDERINLHVYAAFKSIFNEKFYPGYAMFEITCGKCGKLFEMPCQSWRSGNGKDCKRCERKEKEKWATPKEVKLQAEREEVAKLMKDGERYELHRLKTMPYKEYLQTDHWQGLRKEALSRAKYRCQLCYARGTMNVHHRTYERRGCEWMSDLIVLCVPCHEKHHNIFHGDDE